MAGSVKRLLALASRLEGIPRDSYEALSTADGRFPTITLSTGETVQVSYGQYRRLLATCRAQVEVALDAETQDVARNLRGFHCMLAYGDYVREVACAAGNVGSKVQSLPTPQA